MDGIRRKQFALISEIVCLTSQDVLYERSIGNSGSGGISPGGWADDYYRHLVCMNTVPKTIYSLTRPAILAGSDGEAIMVLKDLEVGLDESELNLSLEVSVVLNIAKLRPKGELFLYLGIGYRRIMVEISEGYLRPTHRLEVRDGRGGWIQVSPSRWFGANRSLIVPASADQGL